MNRLSKRSIFLAITLSALAGCVDAIGFLQLGGYFISFMSGNSTQLAVGMATNHLHAVAQLGGIIAMFVAGTVLGTLLGNSAKASNHAATVLALVTALLTGAALCAIHGWMLPAIILITMAMGAENATFQRDGDVIVGLTYMTGTLVKMGQRIAQALSGGKKFEWLPYLLLWLGLIAGGAVGAFLYQLLGLESLLVAAFWAAGLTAFAYWKKPFPT